MTTDEKLKYEKEMTKKATTLSLQEMRDDLDGINRDVYNNQGDRNWWFMVVSHKIYGSNAMHSEIRKNWVKKLNKNKERFIEDFTNNDRTLENFANKTPTLGEDADERMNWPICVAYWINLRN